MNLSFARNLLRNKNPMNKGIVRVFALNDEIGLENHPIKLAAFLHQIKWKLCVCVFCRTKAFQFTLIIGLWCELNGTKPTEWGLFDQIDNIIEPQFKLITLDALFGHNDLTTGVNCGSFVAVIDACFWVHIVDQSSSVKEPNSKCEVPWSTCCLRFASFLFNPMATIHIMSSLFEHSFAVFRSRQWRCVNRWFSCLNVDLAISSPWNGT